MSRESHLASARPLLPTSLAWRIRGGIAALLGAALVLASFVVWLTLLTWSARDPSLSNVISEAASLRNVLGRPGASLADLLVQMLGVAAAGALIAPLAWGGELIARRRLVRAKARVLLWPLVILATAGALSALPTLSRWPLAYGHGGMLGDLAYRSVAGLLSLINPGRAGVAAGLALFGAAAAGAVFVLGLSRAMSSKAGAAPGSPAPVADPAMRLGLEDYRPGLDAYEPSTRAAASAAPALPSLEPAPDLSTPRAAPPARSRPEPLPASATPPIPLTRPVSIDPLFEEATDAESSAIARRFAPERSNAVAGSARQTGHPSEPRPAGYRGPPLDVLGRPPAARKPADAIEQSMRAQAKLLIDVLADFSVKGEIKDIRPGPVVTVFELEPARGTKASRVIGLADDIARSMSVASVRVAVVPGRPVIGIELPNVRREAVALREILEAREWRDSKAALPMALGKSIGGEPVVMDLARMPHLLVAGTTGSGKSVGVNAMILSLLYRHGPESCRFLMIDPKMLELSVYNGIPHLLSPVVTDPSKAAAALGWVVREMEERYKRMASLAVRNIEMYNGRVRQASQSGETLSREFQTGFDAATGEPVYETETIDHAVMPHIVVVVDEFADLMMVAGKDVESAVQRLAQMARAAGIHLIMATQRPSVDVITGTIKANFPTRISFKVASKVDSRTILNEMGAEALLGMGDMLVSTGGGSPLRVHGAFVADDEVERIATFLREQGTPDYVAGITDGSDEPPLGMEDRGHGAPAADDLYQRAVALVLADQKASTSYVQRRLGIGYNRAADLIERMEREGVIGPVGAGGRRAVLGQGQAPGRAA